MRAIAVFIAVSVAVQAIPAHACRGVHDERYTFLPALPKVVPSEAVVLKVRLKPDEKGTGDIFPVMVDEVISGNWDGIEAHVQTVPRNSCSRREFLLTPSYVVGARSSFKGRFNAIEFKLSELRNVEVEGSTIRIEPSVK